MTNLPSKMPPIVAADSATTRRLCLDPGLESGLDLLAALRILNQKRYLDHSDWKLYKYDKEDKSFFWVASKLPDSETQISISEALSAATSLNSGNNYYSGDH